MFYTPQSNYCFIFCEIKPCLIGLNKLKLTDASVYPIKYSLDVFICYTFLGLSKSRNRIFSFLFNDHIIRDFIIRYENDTAKHRKLRKNAPKKKC